MAYHVNEPPVLQAIVENAVQNKRMVLVNPLFSVACTPKLITSFIITNFKLYNNE